MQGADDGPVAEAGGDGGGEEGALVPTVFPPRRPKTYKLKKGQVCAFNSSGLVGGCQLFSRFRHSLLLGVCFFVYGELSTAVA